MMSKESKTSSALLTKAKTLESAGSHKKAQNIYKGIVKSAPLSKEAPEAAFRRAESLYATNELRDAFDAYQDLLGRYRGSHHYSKALERQEEVAHKAASGQINQSFLGLKSNLSPRAVSRMMQQVIDNAPKAPSAARAQYTIGAVWEKAENYDKALAAYRAVPGQYPSSSFAPQSLYNIGSLLAKQSRDGNRNQANIGRAKDAFYDLIHVYPRSKLVPSAKKQIAQLSSSDVQRSFSTAQFYEKKGETTAAIYYYKEVLKLAKSGSMHDQAKQKIASLTR